MMTYPFLLKKIDKDKFVSVLKESFDVFCVQKVKPEKRKQFVII